ncbi:AraC family transcriptional regulator [Variovorax ginsengisoli]|uniref:AraC-like DNA-binding protein n=1 Tax=Variovorax ginsengisoli TaxID=363844 RepID=A0ABT9SAT2_9BURK|nr:AraC family transcriptional regulator [Variovorax ginsengisoli]MDP9901448.1 AraC-like DNA-binding protein [Variovorax ginsengisoli]
MDIALRRPAALPLAPYRLFDSQDLEETRDFVSRVFCPHELATTRPRQRLDACHHSALLHRDASLNYVQYGPGVDIHPGCLRDFFLLQIPLRGGADVRCGPQHMQADPRTASLASPTEPLGMRWHDDSPHLILKLSRTAMQQQLEQLAQRPASRPLVFDLAVPLDTPALVPVHSFIRCLRDSLDTGHAFAGSPLAMQAEGYLMASLLLCLPHNHADMLHDGPRRDVVPRTVRRAKAWLTDRLDLPVTLAELCAHVGVSARALQTAFRAHCGESPMEFLRHARLERVRSELRAAACQGEPLQVASLAARYGFMHAGRFSTDYRRRFGESPSQTLRGQPPKMGR